MGLSVREELHKMIDEADDAQLDEMYNLLNDEGEPYSRYSPEDIAMFYSRLEDLKAGRSKSYTVEEAFEIARNYKK